jgi:hypothetical protein
LDQIQVGQRSDEAGVTDPLQQGIKVPGAAEWRRHLSDLIDQVRPHSGSVRPRLAIRTMVNLSFGVIPQVRSSENACKAHARGWLWRP